jgi:putative tryptophan/tyrosine transport system substrate-binding protein
MTRRASWWTLSRVLAVVVLAGACIAATAEAQESRTPRRIGVLVVSFSPESKEAQAFRQGLREAGYVEGRDVSLEWRFSDGQYDRVPGQAAELVQSKVDLIVADTTVAAQAAKRATSTIPIVMAFVADPVSAGLINSLAHPGGNITGLSMMIPDVSTKRLYLLKEIVPRLARVSVLWNPNSPFHAKVIEDLKIAAPGLGIDLNFITVQKPEDIEPAFSAAVRARTDALYVIEEPVIYTNRMTLLKLLSKGRLPAIFPVRRFVADGGLICYGTNFEDLFRRSAGYVDRILKGADPGTLPVEQPVKFDLVVNLKTAKALGLTIPQSVMVQADEVIR